MINFNHVAVFGMKLLRYHHATGSRDDGRSRKGREVQPGVQRRTAGQRVQTPAKGGAYRRCYDRGCVGTIMLRIFCSNKRDSSTVSKSVR